MHSERGNKEGKKGRKSMYDMPIWRKRENEERRENLLIHFYLGTGTEPTKQGPITVLKYDTETNQAILKIQKRYFFSFVVFSKTNLKLSYVKQVWGSMSLFTQTNDGTKCRFEIRKVSPFLSGLNDSRQWEKEEMQIT